LRWTRRPVVIADFTLTTFCDWATVGLLLAVQRQAAARHAVGGLRILPYRRRGCRIRK